MPKTEYYVPIEAVPVITGDQIRGMTQSVVQAIFPLIYSRMTTSFFSLIGHCSLIIEPLFLKGCCITHPPIYDCDLSCMK